MSALTIHLPEDQYERLRKLAKRRGIRLERLVESLVGRVLADADIKSTFDYHVARGDRDKGLTILESLERISRT